LIHHGNDVVVLIHRDSDLLPVVNIVNPMQQPEALAQQLIR
jgi:hypothetical protein